MSGSVLVTGASGFVGRHLVPALRERGFNVLTPSSQRGALPLPGSAGTSVDHVFHLAAKTYVPESWSDPVSFYETNVLGTVRVLDYCRRSNASVTLISSYVYGKPGSLPISEEQPVDAFNPYSHTKLLSEATGRFYESAFGVPVTIMRPFNLYGPHQDSRFLVPTLLRQALDPHLDVIAVADLRPRRDFLFISDFIDLLLVALEHGARGIFNAGSGVSASIHEVVAIIHAVSGVRKRLVSTEHSRPAEVLDAVADISKARRELGWQPTTSLKDGLTLTIAAFKERMKEGEVTA